MDAVITDSPWIRRKTTNFLKCSCPAVTGFLAHISKPRSINVWLCRLLTDSYEQESVDAQGSISGICTFYMTNHDVLLCNPFEKINGTIYYNMIVKVSRDDRQGMFPIPTNQTNGNNHLPSTLENVAPMWDLALLPAIQNLNLPTS